MTTFLRSAAAGLLVFASTTTHADEAAVPDLLPTLVSLERLDPRFDTLVPRDSVIQVLASGFEWAEGPVWLKREQAVLFSDIPRNRVMRFKDGEGLSVFLEPAGFTGPKPYGDERGSNGFATGPGGRARARPRRHASRHVAHGSGDGRTLYMTADSHLCRARPTTTGPLPGP